MSAFDSTVSLFEEKEVRTKVTKAIANTAKYTKNAYLTIEIAKLLQSSQDEAEGLAELIKKNAKYIKSKEAVKETEKALRLCPDKKETAKTIVDVIKYTRSEEAIIETAKTLALYHDKEAADVVTIIITYIAKETESEEAVIETAKTLGIYHDKEAAELVAEKIIKTAVSTSKGNKNEFIKKTAEVLALEESIKTIELYQDGEVVNAIGDTQHLKEYIDGAKRLAKVFRLKDVKKTVDLYKGKLGSKSITSIIKKTSEWIDCEKVMEATARTLESYYHKRGIEKIEDKSQRFHEVKNIANAIKLTAAYTKSNKIAIKTAETLTQYYDKKEAPEIVNLIGVVALETQNKDATIEALRIISDKDIIKYSGFQKIGYYINKLYLNISRSIRNELSHRDINKIIDTYSLTMDFCKPESLEFQNKVKEGFFHHLNKAMKKGRTIDDKLKIMNKWSDNVYTTFKDHPEDFMEFIR